MSIRPETDLTEAVDALTTEDQLETTESDQLSRIKRYDQRVEDWLASMKEEAGQRSPEVLSALAAKAQDVADYLTKTAEKARAKNEASGFASSAQETSTTDKSRSIVPIESKETQ